LDRHDLSRFFKHLDQTGTPSVDSDGSIWIELSENGEPLMAGASADNALARSSNTQLAYKLLLTRTAGILKSPRHSRETMPEFAQDWSSLQRASAAINTISASNVAPFRGTHAAALASHGGKD
jgi:hypothetical protein